MRREGGQQHRKRFGQHYVTRYIRSKLEKKEEQDQVNNSNTAFIFMKNLFIIQGCQSGSVGQVSQISLMV